LHWPSNNSCFQFPLTLDTPLRTLLAQRHASSSSVALQTCTPEDTLLAVVRKFSSSRALRLVCVEQQGSSKIVGLVSLTDLFKYAAVYSLFAVLMLFSDISSRMRGERGESN
jgi:hypothetical protein